MYKNTPRDYIHTRRAEQLMQSFDGPATMYPNPYKDMPPRSVIVNPSELVWTPDDMTPEQAIEQLPLCCHRHLTVPPCLFTLRWLIHLRKCNLEGGHHASAELVSRCIVTGYRKLSDSDKKMEHALASMCQLEL